MLVVLVGNIGTGKSTYVNSLKRKANRIVLCTDELFSEIQDKNRFYKKLIETIDLTLNANKTIIVDGNNMSKRIRDHFICVAKRYQRPAIIIDFGPGTDITLQRRINNSPEISAQEWSSRHLEHQADYDKPSMKTEFFDRIIRKYPLREPTEK